MSNFKRKGPKSTRAGCLMCKPWKAVGNSKCVQSKSQARADDMFKEQLEEAVEYDKNYEVINHEDLQHYASDKVTMEVTTY